MVLELRAEALPTVRLVHDRLHLPQDGLLRVPQGVLLPESPHLAELRLGFVLRVHQDLPVQNQLACSATTSGHTTLRHRLIKTQSRPI